MANLGVKCVIFFVRRVEWRNIESRDRGDIVSLKKEKKHGKQRGERLNFNPDDEFDVGKLRCS